MNRLLVAVALVVITMTGCGPDRPPLDRLTIAAGAPGTVHRELATALAKAATQRWAIPAEVLPSAAVAENLRLVAAGKADLGFATVDVCAMAMQADAPFRKAMPLAALAGVYEDYLHIVVRADSDIDELRELGGRKVSTGVPESSTEVVAVRVLRAAGLRSSDITRSRLPAAEAAQALRIGAIDAFFVVGGLPTPAVSRLAEQLAIRMLSVPDEVVALHAVPPGPYLSRSIPADIYGLDAEVVTIGVTNVLVVNAGMAVETAFQLTQLLFAAKPQLVTAHQEALRLDPRSAISTFSIPLHPGAQRYYRQSKPMV